MRSNAGIRFHRPAGLMRPVVVGLAVAALAMAGGCSGPPAGQGAASPAGSTTRAPDSTSEYLPGLEADVYLPDRDKGGDAPVVLLGSRWGVGTIRHDPHGSCPPWRGPGRRGRTPAVGCRMYDGGRRAASTFGQAGGLARW